ncbi:DUF790 family protein [Stieleria varia]|uniref:DUF790 family protein n=1 Tax=Stieleria varia TaxID=2528005 RepID=A0A5C6B869_9BACT|nr:DUF790 family protein [Stieleria varia]TWU07957.1 hypothetical protein Pla52n_05340 [Stieleria varia]
MLTKQEAIVQYDFDRQSVTPDRLRRGRDSHYVPLAQQMIQVYQSGIGKPRRDLHRSVERVLADVADCPTRRVAAFCKLLDDASEYHQDRGGAAAKLRKRVFSIAASKHPLVDQPDRLFENCSQSVRASIAAELGMTWDEIQGRLFADVIEFHPLSKPPLDWDAARLLARYNVAQTQAAMYGALSVTVWAKSDFKMILRYAKLAQLMHTIDQRGDNYLFHFNGPASVLRQTRRYGVNFARFLPGLLSTADWKMQATVLGPAKRRFRLQLTSDDGLNGEVSMEEFDSQIESHFAQKWEQTDTDGWTLHREATVLHEGQTVFMPDFTLRHPKHSPVQLEIIGFWTPEYLREKAARLRQFGNSARFILAIAKSTSETLGPVDLPSVQYKTALLPKQILELLKQFSAH